MTYFHMCVCELPLLTAIGQGHLAVLSFLFLRSQNVKAKIYEHPATDARAPDSE